MTSQWPNSNKRENEKMFDFEEDMSKKPILGSHFEFGRHFEIKQNSTQVKTDFGSSNIEFDFLKF